MPEIINLVITVVMIVVCYNLAKKNNMSAAFAFLGLFGIVGAVALILIIKFSGNNSNLKDGNNYNNPNGGYNGNNYNNVNNGYNNNNYNNTNGGYNSNNYNNGNNGYNANNYNNANNGYNRNNYNANNSYNDGGYASQNGGYSSSDEDKFKKCPKCGAKIEKYASFCTYCGKELQDIYKNIR